MKLRALFGLVIVFAAVSGCSTVTIPFAADHSSCLNVEYHPLCEMDVHAAFPELKPTDVILNVDSFDRNDDGQDVLITYSPEVTGPHTVLTKEVICQQANDRRQFWCRMARYTGYYYSKPDYYLEKSGDVSDEDIITVVRLMETGKLASDQPIWPGLLQPNSIYSLSLQPLKGHLALFVAASGCAGPAAVQIQGSGDDQVLRIVDNAILCH